VRLQLLPLLDKRVDLVLSTTGTNTNTHTHSSVMHTATRTKPPSARRWILTHPLRVMQRGLGSAVQVRPHDAVVQRVDGNVRMLRLDQPRERQQLQQETLSTWVSAPCNSNEAFGRARRDMGGSWTAFKNEDCEKSCPA
jgi:hypothetical protein